MKHARKDYARIQDPWGKIGDDEPVFLIRCQDVLFIEILAEYGRRYANLNGADPEILSQLALHTIRARKWQQDHPTKVPDAPTEDCGCHAETLVVAMLPDGTPIGGWSTDAEGNHKPSGISALKEMLNEEHGKNAGVYVHLTPREEETDE